MALFVKEVRERSVVSAGQVRMSRPHQRPRRAHRGAPAYVLVVDESGSTAKPFRTAYGRSASRMAAIRSAAQGYLRQLRAANPWHRVAVVGFSDTATLYHGLAPVGRAFQGLSRAVGRLHPRSMTNLSAGLTVALSQLAKANVLHGNVVVITDGAANVDTARLPGLIGRARASRVRIFTIGVGNNSDSDYDRSLLVRVAQTTGGRFSSTHDFGELCRALHRMV